jgi:hypothetical protein
MTETQIKQVIRLDYKLHKTELLISATANRLIRAYWEVVGSTGGLEMPDEVRSVVDKLVLSANKQLLIELKNQKRSLLKQRKDL